MTISDRTRKILWARSGNRCAICQHELVLEKTPVDAQAIVGDECHIRAQNVAGPRGDKTIEEDDVDSYDNLILLCKTHHQMIDSQPNTYTIEKILQIKATHETWVRETLAKSSVAKDSEPPTMDGVTLLPRVKTGKELVRVLMNAELFQFFNDELVTSEEADFVSDFFRQIQDWGDILGDVSIGDIVQLEFDLNGLIHDLEIKGFLIFGDQRKKKMSALGINDMWTIAMVSVIRETNLSILRPISNFDVSNNANESKDTNASTAGDE